MRKLNNIILLAIIPILSLSCDDILEENITNDIIQIVTPQDGEIIEGNTVQFSWQNLDGADNYRIQVIKSNQVYELDSLITTNTFVYILEPGTYQWRVKGKNFAYETPYTFPANFSVIESSDLSNQNVALLTPSDNFYTNSPNFNFTWSPVNSTISYDFEIVKSLNGQTTVFQQSEIAETNISVDENVFDEDAEYIWKVKAVNANSETEYAERSIFIDRVVPNQPTLISPEDQGTSSLTVSFNWSNGADSGNVQSTITNTIEIASDIDFNSVVHSASTVNNTYQYVFSTPETYYWRIIAKDEATNQSDYSIVRSIIVQQ